MENKKNNNIIKLIIAAIIIPLIILIIFKTGAIEYIKDREKMKAFIDGFGIWGPLVYIVIYALVTITMISAAPLTALSGLIFGPVLGVVYTAIGAGIGLSLAFLLARYIAHQPIQNKFGNTKAFKVINEGVKNEGWFILATTRLIPVFPFGIQNYVYGLTSINFWQYSILSTLLILPGTAIYVLLGGALASGDPGKAAKLAVIASLLLFSLILIPKLILKKNNSGVKDKDTKSETEKI